MGDFEVLAWRSVLIEFSDRNCDGLFCRRDTLLMHAIKSCNASIVRLLLEYGADANAQRADYE